MTDPLEITISGSQHNDVQSQEQLYRLCYPEMIKICFRYAGDMDGAGLIFNNAMLKAFKALATYQHQGKLISWIKTIVIHCCIDYVKKQNRFRQEPLELAHEENTSIPEEVFSKVSVKEIQKIISQLPKATAVVFNLFVYEGYTHRQISQALGISEGTSKWHVNEGRKVLKVKLEPLLTRN